MKSSIQQSIKWLSLGIWCCLGLVSNAADKPDSADTLESAASPDEDASFGGPGSVAVDLEESRRLFPPAANLTLGGDYFLLGQSATSSLGETSAVGGVGRLYGRWDLLRKGNNATGSIIFKVENRHAFTDLSPQSLGFEIGYAGLTAITFSDAGWLLTNLYWQQALFNNRISFVAGVVDTTDYVDIYWLADPWTGFFNLGFSTNPTIPVPNQGLGGAVRLLFGEHLYGLAGFADANADPNRPQDFVEVFSDDAELFSHVELGWVSSYEERFTNNIHLIAWNADSRPAEGISSGTGVAFSASWLFGDHLAPFLRLGYSDGSGSILDRSVSAGLGYQLNRLDDTFAFGVNVGRPAKDTFDQDDDNQLTVEAFYHFHLNPHFEITPDIQYIRNLAHNPDENDSWVFGLRVRVSL